MSNDLSIDWWREEAGFFDKSYLSSDHVCNQGKIVPFQVSFIEQALNLHQDMKILDAPCGEGMVSRELLRRGYPSVLGLDINLLYVEEARRKIFEELPYVPPHALYIHGNIQRMPLANSLFDVVLCTGSSLGYEDTRADRMALSEMCRVLQPNGTLLIELWRDSNEIENPEVLEPHTWNESWADGTAVVVSTRFDQSARRVRIRQERKRLGADAPITVEISYHTYSEQKMWEMCIAAGFNRVEIHHLDYWKWKPVQKSDAYRMVLIARK